MTQRALSPAELKALGIGDTPTRVPSSNNLAGDLMDLSQASLAHVPAQAIEGVNQLTGFGILQGVQQKLNRFAGKQEAQVSVKSRKAIDDSRLQGDTFQDLHFGPDASARGIALQAVPGLASAIPFLAGGASLRGLGVLAGLPKGAASALGYGIVGGAVNAGASAEQASDEFMDSHGDIRKHPNYKQAVIDHLPYKLRPGEDFDPTPENIAAAEADYPERGPWIHREAIRQLDDEVKHQAALEGFGGGFLTNAIAGPALDKLVRGTGGPIKSMLRGAATEIPQEAAEQISQDVAVNRAVQPYDDRSLMKDVLPNAVMAGAMGGFAGGAIGGITGGINHVLANGAKVDPEQPVQPPQSEVGGETLGMAENPAQPQDGSVLDQAAASSPTSGAAPQAPAGQTPIDANELAQTLGAKPPSLVKAKAIADATGREQHLVPNQFVDDLVHTTSDALFSHGFAPDIRAMTASKDGQTFNLLPLSDGSFFMSQAPRDVMMNSVATANITTLDPVTQEVPNEEANADAVQETDADASGQEEGLLDTPTPAIDPFTQAVGDLTARGLWPDEIARWLSQPGAEVKPLEVRQAMGRAGIPAPDWHGVHVLDEWRQQWLAAKQPVVEDSAPSAIDPFTQAVGDLAAKGIVPEEIARRLNQQGVQADPLMVRSAIQRIGIPSDFDGFTEWRSKWLGQENEGEDQDETGTEHGEGDRETTDLGQGVPDVAPLLPEAAPAEPPSIQARKPSANPLQKPAQPLARPEEPEVPEDPREDPNYYPPSDYEGFVPSPTQPVDTSESQADPERAAAERYVDRTYFAAPDRRASQLQRINWELRQKALDMPRAELEELHRRTQARADAKAREESERAGDGSMKLAGQIQNEADYLKAVLDGKISKESIAQRREGLIQKELERRAAVAAITKPKKPPELTPFSDIPTGDLVRDVQDVLNGEVSPAAAKELREGIEELRSRGEDVERFERILAKRTAKTYPIKSLKKEPKNEKTDSQLATPPVAPAGNPLRKAEPAAQDDLGPVGADRGVGATEPTAVPANTEPGMVEAQERDSGEAPGDISDESVNHGIDADEVSEDGEDDGADYQLTRREQKAAPKMWLVHSGGGINRQEQRPAPMAKGTYAMRSDRDFPAEAAAKALVGWTAGGKGKGGVKQDDGDYTKFTAPNGETYKLSRVTNMEGEKVWVAHTDPNDPLGAYAAQKHFELVELGENRVALRETEVPTSVEGDSEGVSEGFLKKLAHEIISSGAKIPTAKRVAQVGNDPKGPKFNQSPDEGLLFNVPEDLDEYARLAVDDRKAAEALPKKQRTLDLVGITKLGKAVRTAGGAPSPAKDRQMVARNDFLSGLTILRDKFGIELAERADRSLQRIVEDEDFPAFSDYFRDTNPLWDRLLKKKGPTVPGTAIIHKSGKDTITWRQANQASSRLAEADIIDRRTGAFLQDEDADAQDLYRAPLSDDEQTLRSMGSTIREDAEVPDLYAGGSGETEEFGLSGLEEGKSPRDAAIEFDPWAKNSAGTKPGNILRKAAAKSLRKATSELEASEAQGPAPAELRHNLAKAQARVARTESNKRAELPRRGEFATPQVTLLPGTRTMKPVVAKFVEDMSNLLGIRTAVSLADELGLAEFRTELMNEIAEADQTIPKLDPKKAKDQLTALKTKRAQHQLALKHVEDALTSGEATFLALDTYSKAEDRKHIIFLPKGELSRRTDQLLHELGHFVQRNAVDQLLERVMADETEAANRGGRVESSREDIMMGRNREERRQLLQDLFGVDKTKDLRDLTPDDWWRAEEAFANNFAAWAKSNREPKSLIEKFFAALGKKIKDVWNLVTGQAKPSESFDAFMDSLIGRAQGVQPKTVLGRKYLAAINDITTARNPSKGKAMVAQKFTNPLAYAAKSDRLKKASKSVGEFLIDLSPAWAAVNTQMRQLMPKDVKVDGVWLPHWFHHRPGETPGNKTFREQWHANSTPYIVKMNALFDASRNKPGQSPVAFDVKSKAGRARYDKIVRGLTEQRPDSWFAKNGYTEGLEVRKFFNEVGHEVQRMGLDLVMRQNYTPLVIDKTKWNADPEKITRIIYDQIVKERKLTDPRKLHLAEQLAGAIYQKIALSDGALFFMGDKMVQDSAVSDMVLGPSFKYSRSRALSPEMHRALADYYISDLAQLMHQYTHSAFKRATAQKMFGGLNADHKLDPMFKVNEALKLATRPNGLKRPLMTHAQMDRVVRTLLPAEFGTLGQNEISPSWRAFQSWAMFGLNVGLLPLSVLSNIVELGQIGIRAKNPFVGVTRAVKLLASKSQRSDLRKLAYRIGAIRDDIMEHAIANSQDPAYQIGITHRLSEKYFRAIGMKWFSDFERITALGVARDALGDYAANPSKYAKELAELGVTAAEIKAWRLDPNGQHDSVMLALNRWIDSAILRPNASIRPAWGSDPRWAICFHLKDPLWGFSEVVLRRLWAQSKDQKHLLKLLPWAMAGAALLPLAFLGYELRKELTQDIPASMLGVPVPNKPKSADEVFFDLLERSGALGPMALMLDMEDAAEHGEFFLFAAAGPSLDKFQELLRHDMDIMHTLSHTLPIFAQSRVIREQVFGPDY